MAKPPPPARPPLRTERLLALLEVARHEGFSRAARALGRTQSSLSQSVAALEAEVGAPLLVREGRRTRPTEAGRLLVASAERVLAELEHARDELDALGALTRGRLVVGTTDTLAMHVLPPVLRELRVRHPGIELVLENRPSPIIAERVADGAVDVGVVTLPLPADLRIRGRAAEGELRLEPLATFEDAFICRAEHRLAQKSRVAAADLEDEPMLLLDRSTAGRAHLDAWFAARRVTPRVAMEMASVEVLVRLVELGFGVSVVPAAAVAGRGTPLVRRPLLALRARRVGLVTPNVGPLSPAARAFVALARSLVSPAGNA
jgi:DNA-binding transcriptional LysR family regulator